MTSPREKLGSGEEVQGPSRLHHCMGKAGPSLPAIRSAGQGRAGLQTLDESAMPPLCVYCHQDSLVQRGRRPFKSEAYYLSQGC